MKKNWEIEIDGVKHTIEYKAGFGCKLIVDGEVHKVKSSNWFINVVDYLIAFGGTECRLVAIGNSVDLAVDGTFINSKKPYEPVAGVPAWVWVLVGISTVGGYALSGILSMAIGILMSTLYVNLALQKKKGAVIGCFIACGVLQALLFVAMAAFMLSTNMY